MQTTVKTVQYDEGVSSLCPIGYSGCVSYRLPILCKLQFKGQGFLGPPLILSLSCWNLMVQAEIKAPWPPEGLLTPVCLSLVQGRAVYLWCCRSALWAHLVASQFHLDCSQNELDLTSSGHLLPSCMIVNRLWRTTLLYNKFKRAKYLSVGTWNRVNSKLLFGSVKLLYESKCLNFMQEFCIFTFCNQGALLWSFIVTLLWILSGNHLFSNKWNQWQQ